MSFRNYKKIIFHCGLHKTGSSYLQLVLKENAEVLLQHGIHYPEFVTRNGHVHQGNHSVIAVSYRDDLTADENFSRFVNLNSGADTLLISGEEFSREGVSAKILTEVKKAAPDATLMVLLYLRRVDHMIESVYAESVKDRLSGGPMKAGYQLNYTKIVDAFETAVDKANVILRPYNKDRWFNGRLLDDFMASIGCPDAAESLNVPDSRVNERLSRQQTHALSLLTQKSAKRKLLNLFLEMNKTEPTGAVEFFRSTDDRRRLVQNCRTLNSPLAERYGLGDIDVYLGSDQIEDGWVPFVADDALILSWMCRVLDAEQ